MGSGSEASRVSPGTSWPGSDSSCPKMCHFESPGSAEKGPCRICGTYPMSQQLYGIHHLFLEHPKTRPFRALCRWEAPCVPRFVAFCP
jgi:hypothetical protein